MKEREPTRMNDTPFAKYLNHEGIFLERNLVIQVRLVAVSPLTFGSDVGADLELFAIKDLQTGSESAQRLPFELGSTFDVGSIMIEDCQGILRASGYANWTLVFNERAKRHIIAHAESSDLRKIIRDALNLVSCPQA